MSTAEPILRNPVRTFDLTVVSAQGTFNPLFIAKSAYAVVEIGGQRQITQRKYGTMNPVWNETWSFASTAHIKDMRIKIQLYHVVPFKDDILTGEFEARLLACEPRNTDIVKSLKTREDTGKYKVTFRIGEMKFSGPQSRIQALVIGIDAYPKIPKLQGCVNDALAMKALLSDRFHVPDAQIKLLLDKSATRNAILSYLEMGFTGVDCDSIVIYFAGHGSRIETPPHWPSGDDMIETICPYDSDLQDHTGEIICGIEDFRFNILLHKLAARKENNNITVILDLCHSAGASREDNDEVDGVRGVNITASIPKDWKEVLSTANREAEVSIPKGFRYDDLASHVLLAACGQYEKAREVTDIESKLPRGRFTLGLVKHLYEIAPDTVTNQELIGLLPQWPNQRPQCVGSHSRRILFDSKVVVTDMESYVSTVKDEGREVQIGTVQGVVEGTEFTALLPHRPVLVTTSVNAHSSFLTLRDDGEYNFPTQTRVIVSNWKNEAVILKVFLPSDSDKFRFLQDDLSVSPPHSGPTSESHSETSRPTRKFMLVNSLPAADIELTVTRSDQSKAEFVISRVDPLTSLVDPSQSVFELDVSKLEHLPRILNRVSHFHFYLGNHNSAPPLRDQISVEMFELDNRTNLPTGPDLFACNHAVIVEIPYKKYGFRLLNRSEHNLFPYLFYFDPRYYRIKVWHTPNEPVKAQEGSTPTVMTVGFGAGGGFPFVFTVPNIPNVSSDTGYLKLFVSTERISSFADIGESDPLKPEDSGRDGDRAAAMTGLWDTWIATITAAKPKGT